MATSCSSLLLSDREEVAQDSCNGAEDPAQDYSQNLLVLTSNLTISEEYSTIGNEDEFSGDIVKFDAISNEDWSVLYGWSSKTKTWGLVCFLQANCVEIIKKKSHKSPQN